MLYNDTTINNVDNQNISQPIIFNRKRLQTLAPQLLALCQYLVSSDSYLEVDIPFDKKQSLSRLLDQILENVKLESVNKLTRSISIIWAIEDVQEVRPDLTDEQAAHILEQVKQEHDANYGINWETIEILADMEYPKPDIEAEE